MQLERRQWVEVDGAVTPRQRSLRSHCPWTARGTPAIDEQARLVLVPVLLPERPMYVLTILFLYSHVTLVTVHSSEYDCERLASSARAFTEGPQAVQSATCAPTSPR